MSEGMTRLGTELFIARRMGSRGGGRNNVMVRIATVTVALGTAVMIVAMAVVTGFKREITAKLAGVGSHVRIVSLYSNDSMETDPIPVDTLLEHRIAELPRFRSITRYAMKGAMIKTADAIQGVALKGVTDGYDSAFLRAHLLRGTLPRTAGERSKDLLISESVARKTGLDTASRVQMLFVGGDRPVRRDRFKVCGVYETGMEELDGAMTFTDIRNVQRVAGWSENEISGYEIMTDDFSRLEEFAESVYGVVFDAAETSSDVLKVEDIVSLNPNTFDWLKAHDTNALVIIVIMLAVSFLNMMSAMLIILLEKTRTIGVLKALGMTDGGVRRVFLLRSLRIVGVGMLWGNAIGLALCMIQKYTGLLTLDSAGYMLSSVPVAVEMGWWLPLNVALPVVMAVLLLIPAQMVSSIRPERTVRYQ